VRDGRAGVRSPRRGGLQAAGRRWGPVTLTFIAVNVAMFVVTAVSAALTGHNPLNNYQSPVFRDLAQVPFLVQDGEWWRVVTAAFLHYGLVHLALNMLALLVFGSELERRLGRWRFAGVYVASIFGGALALQLFSTANVPAAGASTAIWGLFGALGVLMLFGREDMRGLVTLLVLNVVISLLPGVSLIGHFGGLVAGVVTATVLMLTRRRPALQGTGLVVVAVLLLVLALTVPISTVYAL
jgi:membrane associated rhomboid family serine protease